MGLNSSHRGQCPPFTSELIQAGVHERLGLYSVALLKYTEGVRGPGAATIEFSGSGTLVKSRGEYYILTAAHVWTKKLQYAQEICINVWAEEEHRFSWQRDDSIPHLTAAKEYGPEGPDICFVRVPCAYAAAIERGNKVFYNLGDDKPEPRYPADKKGHWALVGVPSEMVSSTANHVAGIQPTFLAPPPSTSVRAPFDYLEFQISRDQVASFDGVSGGGVWWVWFKDDGSIGVQLEGVAFYQDFEGDLV